LEVAASSAAAVWTPQLYPCLWLTGPQAPQESAHKKNQRPWLPAALAYRWFEESGHQHKAQLPYALCCQCCRPMPTNLNFGRALPIGGNLRVEL
jgi:hypothetical protein